MLYLKKGCDFDLEMLFDFDITDKNLLITCKSVNDKRNDNLEAIYINDIAIPSNTPEDIQNALDGKFYFHIPYTETIEEKFKLGDTILQVELKDNLSDTIQDMEQDFLKIIPNLRK